MARYNKHGKRYLHTFRKKSRGQYLKKYWEEKKRGKKNKDPKLENPPTVETPKPSNENNGFGPSGRRIVNISYFIQQLMQLNLHGSSGCSLNSMNIVSETRTGLASEIKFKCFTCNFEKCVWTDDISSQFPVSCTAGITEIRNGFSPLDELLDALNVISVPINASTAEQDEVNETSDQSEMRKTVELEKQLAVREDDADTEGFSVVVDGTRAKRRHGTLSYASFEKRPERTLDTGINSILEQGPSSLMTTVTPSIMMVEVDSRALITPDIDPPDLSMPGPSSRFEPSPSKTEPNLAMTCEFYDSDALDSVSLPEIKEEPKDPDKSKHAPSLVVHKLNIFSESSSSTSNPDNSLFHPPVLIKEEVSFEEDS